MHFWRAALEAIHVGAKNSDDDTDVFGSGKVKILKAARHSPGHRSLLVELAHSGLSCGNDRTDTLASMDLAARTTANTNARMIIYAKTKFRLGTHRRQ